MEKRRESRTDVSWLLNAAAIEANGRGATVNASLSGFLITTDFELTIGELVLMRVALDSTTSINCLAQVVRKESDGPAHTYGADIRYISAADRQRINFALLAINQAAA